MKLVLIIILLMGFLLVHLVKMMRLYLIVLDREVPVARFVPGYLRTTLVNMIIPFKLGEIYRVYVFYRISGGFKTGFFSVLIDRFFDTLAIVLILLPYQLLISRTVTIPVCLLTVFLVTIVFAYMIFSSTYSFLNRYIITTKSSKQSIWVLKVLEVLSEAYEYVKNLVKGRYGIMMLMSIVAWILEIVVLAIFARIVGERFNVADFGAYIESIITGRTYSLKNQYSIFGICVMAVLTVISLIVYMFILKRKAK